MNETMSLLLATTILAFGSLGLYMFKSNDENQSGGDEEYNENGLSIENTDFDTEKLENLEDQDYYKPRRRSPKTHKNRKNTGNSRRRY